MLFRKEKCFPEMKRMNLACDRPELVGCGVTGLMTNSAGFILSRGEHLGFPGRGILRAAADFDSAMRRFESSRPSQNFGFVFGYLASDTFGSKFSFRTLIRPSFRTFVAGSFASRCAWRLRVANKARSNVSFA
jgi:hypothetical protein